MIMLSNLHLRKKQASNFSSDAAIIHGSIGEILKKTRNKWSKEKVPYAQFVEGFRSGRLNTFAGGETWGKSVRAACLFYRYSKDNELKKILSSTVEDLLSCQRTNGSISCAKIEDQPDGPGGDLWERKYVLLGLEHYYSDVDANPKVLKSLIRQVDCIIEQIGLAPKTGIETSGWSPNKIESSTLLEPVMRLYQLTGEDRFLDFASYIIEQGGCAGYDLIEEAIQCTPPHQMAGGIYPKAYEMLSFFEGVIEYHITTGDERCRQAALNLFESVRTREITITGSGGGDAPYNQHGECWNHSAHEQTNPALNRTMETCVTVTWLKFCMQIFRLTGESTAIDEIERTFYNALLGGAHPSGMKFSYMNRLNGVKSDPDGWGVYMGESGIITCCDLNGPMGLACIPQIATSQTTDGLSVNLFIPGTYNITSPTGQSVQIVVNTEYPKLASVEITLQLSTPESFNLRIRIPRWSAHNKLKVGDKYHETPQGQFCEIDRTWVDGERISLTLDLSTRIIESSKNNRVAIVRGPVVFARDENMDVNFDQAVSLDAHNKTVEAVNEKPYYYSVQQQIKITTPLGDFRMIDYASINNWNGLRTCTWMPKAQS
jgi:DUF1680 family protein